MQLLANRKMGSCQEESIFPSQTNPRCTCMLLSKELVSLGNWKRKGASPYEWKTKWTPKEEDHTHHVMSPLDVLPLKKKIAQVTLRMDWE